MNAVQNNNNSNNNIQEMIKNLQILQQNNSFDRIQNICVTSMKKLFEQYSQLLTSEMEDMQLLLVEELQELHEELTDLKSNT